MVAVVKLSIFLKYCLLYLTIKIGLIYRIFK